MKKFRKIIIYFSIGVFFTIGVLLSYIKFALPNIAESPDLKIALTPVRVERGEYLANHVAICMDCHSTRDWTKLGGPIISESIGAGGELFDESVGMPGKYYAPNITPHNLKTWTDGEIFRTVTTGVNKDGKALFPIMPYTHFRKMDKEDIYSIIAYIRTLPSKKTQVPPSESNFPMNFIINTLPVEAELKSKPNENDRIAYGKYLVNAASCTACHNKKDKGADLKGFEFAGGNQYGLPNAVVTTANITPDPETGIGKWSEEMFVNRFRAYREIAAKPKSVSKGEFQTIMPWTMYSGMKDRDLEAIYSYLKTVKPVRNKVNTFASK